jgi:hypothetical protein
MPTIERSDVTRLYADTVDVTAVSHSWDSETYGEAWDYIEAPECPACGSYGRWIAGDDLADLLGDESRESLPEGAADDRWPAWRCPDVACEHFGDGLEDIGDRPEGPMMSYFYPLPERDSHDQSSAERIADLPLCIVTFEDGGTALALTGGGMDLSWEIAEAFMRLGYLPPLAYCDLPRMAGMAMDERHRWILAGCLRTCEVIAYRAECTAEDLRRFTA